MIHCQFATTIQALLFVTKEHMHSFITLLKSITKFCGSDNIMQNILHIWAECGGNIPWNIVSPTKHRYGYE